MTQNSPTEWDVRRARIRELPSGVESGFDEFVEDIEKLMAEAANEVGRPIIMKVSVDVKSGELARFEGDDDE